MKLYKNADNSWTLGTLLSVPSGTCFIEEISADVYAIRFINAPSNIFIGAITDLERSDESPYEDIATFLLECGDFFVNPLNPLKEDVEGLQEDVNQLQVDVSAIQGGYLGTLLHTDAAPEPGVSGIYKFISAGAVSWLSGTPTVAVGDEVSVVFTAPTYTYIYIQNPYELLANKQNSLAADGTGAKYPTVDAVRYTIIGNERTIAESLLILQSRIQALEGLLAAGVYSSVQSETVSAVSSLQFKGAELILQGAGAPVVVPDFIGQIYVKTDATVAVYIATGIATSGDWKSV